MTPGAMRRLSLLEVAQGLLLKPSATMWRLRDEGLLCQSLLAAVVLGGFGFSNSQWLERFAGHSQPIWASWLVGLLLAPVMLLASMLLTHAASLVIWRLGDRPVPGASFTTLLRLGGYGALPSAIVAVIQNSLMLGAIRTGSFDTARAIYLGVLPISLAGIAWALLFRIRLLRTVYLTSWGNALAIMVLASLLTWAVFGSATASLYGVSVARVDWDVHLTLGADPALMRVVHLLPQAGTSGAGVGASALIVPLRAAPNIGDIVVYYPSSQAPPWRQGRHLPGSISFGLVVARAGEAATLGIVPQASVVLSAPKGTDGSIGTETIVPLANVAGIAVSTTYWTQRAAARLLR